MKPQFPPLIKGHALSPNQHPARKAASGFEKGRYGAGDLLWIDDKDTLHYALVLEPDVSRIKAHQMLFVQMVALGDAIGALSPPEIAITHHWPNKLLANGAEIGQVDLLFSEKDDENGHPVYLVLSTYLKVRPEEENLNPGYDKNKTTLWDEGCSTLDAIKLLDSSARHFMTWLHNWEEEGFKPVLLQLDERMEQGHALLINGEEGCFLGLDEEGNVLFKREQGAKLVKLCDVLETGMDAFIS